MSPSSKSLLSGLLAACLAGAACTREADSPPSTVAAESASAEPGMVALREPQLDRFEPAVREQIGAAKSALDELTAEGGSASALGRAYGDLARQYHAYELYEPAADAYVNAMTLQPVDFRWPYYLGQVYRQLAQLEPARAAFERALELRPDGVPILVAAARTERDLGHADRADELARRALELDGGSGGAAMLLAELAADREDWQAAVDRYEALLERQPQATRLYQPLATAYRQLGDAEKASGLLARRGEGAVVVSDPLMADLEGFRTGVQVDLDAGEQAFQRGDFTAAAAAFRRAVEDDPESVQAQLNLGSALLRGGDAIAALERYEAAARLDPARAEAHFDIGVAKSRLGDVPGAIAAYRAALAADPEYREPRFNLANALRRGGACAEAREHYLRLIEANPGDASSRLGEAVCLVEEQRYAEARQRLKEALQAIPLGRSLANAGARLLAAAPDAAVRDGEQALRLARQLMQVEPRPEYSETLAMALAEVGQFDEALEIQRQLLSGAESAKLEALIPRLRANLERYERGEACRDPAIAEVSSRSPERGAS
jgi:tetratricopeptide (TPR) repeat protein